MAESATNHYAVLGVAKNASEQEIKSAYRRLVRTYHPDVSVDELTAQAKFVEIVAAHQALSDPLERAFYDQKLAQDAQRLETERRRRFEESFRQQTVEALLTTAEIYRLRGEMSQAIEYCQRVLKAERHNAGAFALLGDVYLDQAQFDDATMMYSYAVQYAPESELYQRKLERAVARERTQPPEEEETDAPVGRRSERVGLFAVCAAGVAVFALVASVVYLRVARQQLVTFHEW